MQQPHYLCVNFAHAYSRYKLQGQKTMEAFLSATNEFKREIKFIRISNQKEGEIRAYLFSDDSSATYDVNGDFFKFK